MLLKDIISSGTPFPNEGRISERVAKMAILKPATRPDNPRFSSGPCAKPPTWNHRSLAGAWLGRSHRASGGRLKLMDAINKTRQILEIPTDYKIGIVPASDTGAYEMAMWSMLGKRPVEMVAWESFGAGWVTDVLKQLKTSNLTKGRIITAHLNTLKPGKLYSIMSRINNLDYFNWFDNITNSSKSYDEFRNLHDERNDIIHNFIDTQKSLKDLENTIVANSNICIHLVVFTQLNLGIFEKNWSIEKINQHYKSSFKSPPITIDKFKTITKKFRTEYVPQKPYFKK